MELKKKFLYLNSNLELIINPKNSQHTRKNNLLINHSYSNSTKNNNNSSPYYLIHKNKNFNSFLSSNYSSKTTKNISKSKDKTKDNNDDSINLDSSKIYNIKDFNKINSEINKINKMINIFIKKMDNLRNILQDLGMIKKNKKSEIKNFLSDKETLEEKLKYITEKQISNKNSVISNIGIDEHPLIKIYLKDLKIINEEKYITKIIKIIKKLNSDDFQNMEFDLFLKDTISAQYFKILNYLNSKSISNIYEINSLINNFFSELSSEIVLFQKKIKITQSAVNFILRILIKIIIITENIECIINYLENTYEEQKKEIEEGIYDIEKNIILLKDKKIKLEKMRNNMVQNMKIFSDKKSPYFEKTISKSNSFNKELLLNNKINSIIRLKPDKLKKAKSYYNVKKNINTKIMNQKNNLNKCLTNYNKDIINKRIFQKYHSRKISNSKIKNIDILSSCSSSNKNKLKTNFIFKENIQNMNDFKKKKFTINLNIRKNNNFIKKWKYLIYINNDNYTSINDNNNKENVKKKLLINGNEKESSENNESVKKFHFSNLFDLTLSNSITNLINSSNKKTFNLPSNRFGKFNSKNFLDKVVKSKGKVYKNIKQNFALDNNQFNKIQLKNNNNFKSEKINDKYKRVFSNKDIIESVCYYKLLDNKDKYFDPLNIASNMNKLGYNEGIIFIDYSKKIIKIKPKKTIKDKKTIENNVNCTDVNNVYNNALNYSYSQKIIFTKNSINKNLNSIQLKDITKIYLDKKTQKIIKIHNVFLKNKCNKDKSTKNKLENNNKFINKNIININKLLNEKEIVEIKDMEHNEKIKAGLCNLFSFIVELNSKQKIEFVLINFLQFNKWFNFLEKVVNDNMQTKKAIQKENSQCYIKKYINYKLKSFITKKSNKIKTNNDYSKRSFNGKERNIEYSKFAKD